MADFPRRFCGERLTQRGPSATISPDATAGRTPQLPARVAIDLGAESCRVSLLRWHGDRPEIELVHRIPNGPVHADGSLRWPFDKILAGLEEGLRKAAVAAPEGIASSPWTDGRWIT